MKIESHAFRHGGRIPATYTCNAENISPPLSISEVPAGTNSLALIVDDPDAPHGDWTHWTVWNLPAGTTEFMEDSIPEGAVEGTTSFGEVGYGGPCPPRGQHRYFFRLYAIDSLLDLPRGALREELDSVIDGLVIEQAELMGVYECD